MDSSGPVSENATKTIVFEPTPPLPAVIRVVGAKSSPGKFRLTDGSVCTVGSAENADLTILDDPSVSRAHLELELVPGGVSVRDKGSRNGTFYLGQRVERMIVTLGSSLTIGAARILIEPDLEELKAARYEGETYRGLLAASPAMRNLFGILARLEGSTVPVHVTGESGVGKELVASAIHEGSGVTGQLVIVNCGAISRELIASELFGHKRGAFTGAVEARKGAFESANDGTLFLDEIGELPLDLQPMLLRVLETGDVRAVGGDRTEKVRVRVVSATHRDLEREVREGRFREDLYYRLAVIKLDVPPLRDRVEDIPLLARKFAGAIGIEFPETAIEELRLRKWPGNVRELRNVVQAYSILRSFPTQSKTSTSASDLNQSLTGFVDLAKPYAELKDDLVDRFQRVYLAALLAHVGGNQKEAAKLSGLDRTYLGRLVAKYNLR